MATGSSQAIFNKLRDWKSTCVLGRVERLAGGHVKKEKKKERREKKIGVYNLCCFLLRSPGEKYTEYKVRPGLTLNLKLAEMIKRLYSSVEQMCRQVNPAEMVSVQLPCNSTCLLESEESSSAINNQFTGDCRASYSGVSFL